MDSWRNVLQRRWLSVGAGLVALAALAWFFFGRGAADTTSYLTAAVDRGDVVAKVSASGSLSALVTVDVGTQVSGRVQSLLADFNSQVKKGELIAKIDPALFQGAVAQARASVVAGEGNLARLAVQADDARRQSERARQMFDQRLISENDRDTALTAARAADAAVRQARGQLEQAQSALQQAETNLRYTDIRAPTDGIVISRAVNVGQTVAASLAAPVLFTIAQDLRLMEVHTNVSESDIGRLQPGMPASFTVDAYPGETFRGTIRDIRNAPQVVQNVVTYDAVIDVSNADLKLKPGMTASVTVISARRDGVLRIPNSALRFRPPSADGAKNGSGSVGAARPTGGGRPARSEPAGDERVAWALIGKSMARRRVQTGLTDGTFTEIVGGELAEGDQVITSMSGGTAAGGSAARPGGAGGFRIL
ncbi:MAG: efflux RND transporter periplasmic adaptor subunit [Steroidobacteraceae bacterium]